MSQQPKQYVVQATPEDQEMLEEVLENSPFNQGTLLRVAMRIGLEAIKKDPMVLMPFLSKQEPE